MCVFALTTPGQRPIHNNVFQARQLADFLEKYKPALSVTDDAVACVRAHFHFSGYDIVRQLRGQNGPSILVTSPLRRGSRSFPLFDRC